MITGAAAAEAAAGNAHRKLLVWKRARQWSILQNVCFADIAALIALIFALRWYERLRGCEVAGNFRVFLTGVVLPVLCVKIYGGEFL